MNLYIYMYIYIYIEGRMVGVFTRLSLLNQFPQRRQHIGVALAQAVFFCFLFSCSNARILQKIKACKDKEKKAKATGASVLFRSFSFYFCILFLFTITNTLDYMYS